MTLITNRGNVRTNLKIDPQKKVWSDTTIDRYINEGQRWIINDPALNWQFSETFGYIVPVLDYQEYRSSSDDNQETYFSTNIRQFLRAKTSDGVEISFGRFPDYNSSSSPSVLTEYASRYFLNAGYDTAATYTTLHNMDTFDGNGTWVGTNDAVSVATDASVYKEGSGSVSFNIDVSNSSSNKATLTNSSMSTASLTDNLDEGGLILWAYLTDANDIKSFEVRFGVNASNYYSSKQYTSDVQGKKYSNGWNRIFIPTKNRQQVGSPTTSIGYLQVNIEFDSSETDQNSCRIDNIQYVNKYFVYYYTRKSTDLTGDSDESEIPSQYQYVYELYAEYKCWRIIAGKEQTASVKLQEAQLAKNTMIEELQYSKPQEFIMPPHA
jgi:hypothetical protein